MKYDVMILPLSPKMTDDEIKGCIQQIIPICQSKGVGFCLTISDFDYDKRDLWNIPKAVSFMRRLIDLGLIAGLEMSTQGDGLVRQEYGLKSLPGLGALEVWMGGTGRLANGINDVDKETFNEFLLELKIANAKAKSICRESPYNTSILRSLFENISSEDVPVVPDTTETTGGSADHKTESIPDGSTRHSCIKWNK